MRLHFKKLAIWLVVLCSVILAPGNAAAQTADSVKDGPVVAVDVQAKTFGMKFAQNTMQFTVTDATVVKKGERDASFADDVKVGTEVVVTYSKVGDNRVASKIVIADGPQSGDYQIVRSFKPDGGGGEGKCGFMKLDGKLLYVARNNVLLVVDVAQEKAVGEVPVRGIPRGVALVSPVNRGFVTVGGDEIVVFDLKTYAVLGRITVEGDATACVYDVPSKQVLVCSVNSKYVYAIPQDIELNVEKPASPPPPLVFESRVFDIVSDGYGTAYVATPDTNGVTLIETRSMSMLTRWWIHQSAQPVGVALDAENSRIFVWLWQNRLTVLSLVDGRTIVDGRELGVDLRNRAESMTAFGGKAFLTSAEGNLLVVGQGSGGGGGKFDVLQKLPVGVGVAAVAGDQKTGVVYLPGYDSDGGRPAKISFKVQVLEKK